ALLARPLGRDPALPRRRPARPRVRPRLHRAGARRPFREPDGADAVSAAGSGGGRRPVAGAARRAAPARAAVAGPGRIARWPGHLPRAPALVAPRTPTPRPVPPAEWSARWVIRPAEGAAHHATREHHRRRHRPRPRGPLPGTGP